MAYRVVNDFTDTKDKNKEYKRGDEYPRGAYKPSKERIEELSQIHPRYNLIFIEEVASNTKKTTTKTAAKTSSASKDKE